MADDFEVLSAVLDGEPVDIESLQRALDDPRGRRSFVNFVDLRQRSAGDETKPSSEFYRRAAATGLTTPVERGTRRVPVPLAAAAVLLAMLLGSFFNSNIRREENTTTTTPPPEPTRVLRFERGVDWR